MLGRRASKPEEKPADKSGSRQRQDTEGNQEKAGCRHNGERNRVDQRYSSMSRLTLLQVDLDKADSGRRKPLIGFMVKSKRNGMGGL